MSSSKTIQNKSKKKNESLRSGDLNHSDFHEKLGGIGTNSQLPCVNKQGARTVAKPGLTREVSFEGSQKVNFPGNSSSTSGTRYKEGEIVKLGSAMGSHNEKNKLSIIVKQKSSSVLKTNVFDCTPPQGKKEQAVNNCVNAGEVSKKTRKKKRSKNNSVKMLQNDGDSQSRGSGSVDFLKIISTSQGGKFSPSFTLLNNPHSEVNATTHALINKYNPFIPGRISSSSEIMMSLAGFNQVRNIMGNSNSSAPTTSSVSKGVCQTPSMPPGRKRKNVNLKTRVIINKPPVDSKKDLSQASLINRYNRAHRSKVRDLKEEPQRDPRSSERKFENVNSCAGQYSDYLKEGKPYSRPCTITRNQSKMDPSAAMQKNRGTPGIMAPRPLSPSRFHPPPIIYFKSSGSCSLPGSSSGTEVQCELPGSFDHQEDANMEWEGIEDEKVMQNIKVLRESCQDFGNLNQPIEDMDTNCLDASEDNTGDCLIVLDTNILLSHLKFVAELSKQKYEGIGCPILVIPWMVLKELDAFKGGPKQSKVRNTALQAKARSAVHFLNSCFSSRHSRIKGQSALDDKEHCIEIDVPDDSILNCCLQLKAKRKRVILLSNDVNFCNKAMATGVISYGKEQMNKALILGNLDFAANEPGTLVHGASSSQTETEKRFDQTVFKFKILLQAFLTKFIESEMKRVYKEWWIKVILRKPPWSLLDSLQNVSKHWVAVFGFVMDKNGQKVIQDLISAFKTEGSCTGSSPMEAEKIVELAVELCGTIISDNYQAMAMEYKNSFMSLLKILEDCKTGDNSGSQSQPNNSTLVSQPSAMQSDQCAIFEIFQYMWVMVNNFCGVVCDTFGIAHDVSYEKPEHFPSVEEVKGKIPGASHFVHTVVTCLSKILETPENHLSVEHPAILALHSLIQSMVPPGLIIEKDITIGKLFTFCSDENVRVTLSNGLKQYQGIQMLLLQVLSNIS